MTNSELKSKLEILKNEGTSFLGCLSFAQKELNISLLEAKEKVLNLGLYSDAEKAQIIEFNELMMSEFKYKEVQMKLGIDFGGVIIKPLKSGKLLFSERSKEIMQKDAFITIGKLNRIMQEGIWIISKASRITKSETLKWLSKNSFYQETNFIPSNIVFCSKRIDKIKIIENIGLDYYIDDNEETILSLLGIVPNLFYWGSKNISDNVINVQSWDDIIYHITLQTEQSAFI